MIRKSCSNGLKPPTSLVKYPVVGRGGNALWFIVQALLRQGMKDVASVVVSQFAVRNAKILLPQARVSMEEVRPKAKARKPFTVVQDKVSNGVNCMWQHQHWDAHCIAWSYHNRGMPWQDNYRSCYLGSGKPNEGMREASWFCDSRCDVGADTYSLPERCELRGAGDDQCVRVDAPSGPLCPPACVLVEPCKSRYESPTGFAPATEKKDKCAYPSERWLWVNKNTGFSNFWWNRAIDQT